MAKYISTGLSYGYRGRYWDRGELFTVSKDEPKPPAHSFRLVKASDKDQTEADAITGKAALGC